jgi:hypothetical protein
LRSIDVSPVEFSYAPRAYLRPTLAILAVRLLVVFITVVREVVAVGVVVVVVAVASCFQ